MITTLLLSGIALGKPTPDEAQIRALCDRIDKVTAAHDYKALKATTTTDFKQTDIQHVTVNRDQLMVNFAKTFGEFQQMVTTHKILSLKTNGTTATGKIVWTVNAKLRGHAITLVDTEIDNFRKVNGQWLESKVQELDGKALIDGKPIPTGVKA